MPQSGRFQFRRVGTQAHEPWFRVGSVDATTTVIVTALCVLSFFLYALNKAIVFKLGLYPGLIEAGQVWRIFTWPFQNVPNITVAIDIAMFWYFGSKAEELLGRRRFFALVALLTIIPGLLVVALGYVAFGISALSFAMFLIFAIEHPNAQMFFGIKAWVIAAVYLGVRLLQILGDRATAELIISVVSLLLMVTALRAWGAAETLSMFPKLPLVDRIRTSSTKKSGSVKRPAEGKRKGGAKLRSVPTPGDTPGKASAGAWPAGAIRQEEVDRLLEKIASSGINSLSADERRTLDLASKNLRDRHE
jgi:membrane associated rhomboid family serine protease